MIYWLYYLQLNMFFYSSLTSCCQIWDQVERYKDKVTAIGVIFVSAKHEMLSVCNFCQSVDRNNNFLFLCALSIITKKGG